MVIDGTAQFQCPHEYVAIAGGAFLVCHRCQLKRHELPISDRRQSLLFFPTSVREMQAERSKVANG